MQPATLLITNPGSRSGDSDLGEAVERLEAMGPVHFPRAERPEDLPDLVRAHGGKVDRIIVGGGDGTFNLVLDALLEAGRPVGILPLGTANDLARSLEIPDNLQDAVDIITAGDLRPVDVATVNGVSFINAVGIGLGPRMTREMEGQAKSRLGVLAYLAGLLNALRTQHTFEAEVRCPGKTVHRHFIQITIANGIHYGGGMTVADDAKIDDGQLDVLLIPSQSRWTLLWNALRFRTGNIHASDHMTHVRCDSISIHTRARLDVTADGEFLTETPVECSVRSRALEIFAPTG